MLLSWSEAFYCISEYFKNGDVQTAGLLSPVIFSFLPFAAIFIQLEERKYTRDGSGIVLLLYFGAFCAFLPAMITGTHQYSTLSLISPAEQFQRALKYSIWTTLLLFLAIASQIMPDSPAKICSKPDKEEASEAWEEQASLLSRILFHWFGRIIYQQSKEPITAEDLPSVPVHLKCENSFHEYREEWQNTDQKLVFIAPRLAV